MTTPEDPQSTGATDPQSANSQSGDVTQKGNADPQSLPTVKGVVTAKADDQSMEQVAAVPDVLLTKWLPLIGVSTAGIVTLVVTVASLFSEEAMYRDLLANAREATRACPGVYLAYTAAIAPFHTFAWFRSAVVFVSLILVFVGAVFVLGQVRGDFDVTGNISGSSAKAQSTYGGILMMLIGAVLVGLGLFRSATPTLQNAACDPNPAWTKGQSAFVLDNKLSLTAPSEETSASSSTNTPTPPPTTKGP